MGLLPTWLAGCPRSQRHAPEQLLDARSERAVGPGARPRRHRLAYQLDHARRWIDALQATGGTAIDAALTAALDLRTADANRTFTVVFFTDGVIEARSPDGTFLLMPEFEG